jgi:RING-variant domain
MSAFQRAAWQWPTGEDALREEHVDPTETVNDEQPVEHPQAEGGGQHDEDEANSQPSFQRHYPARTCRICLEEVLPSFEGTTGGIPSILHPAPNVKYISSDPSSGRLIRPCKCRGSQKYVHEGCLQEWRHADPAMGTRNYWECPTCKFRYRLERMRWSRYISSTFTQIAITLAIMLAAVFVFGFVADPIINLYLDPLDTITSLPSGGRPAIRFEDEQGSWIEHFLKGLASLGLLGFVKVFFAMGPLQWFNIRLNGGFGGRRRRGGGRDRLEDISWTVVIIGIITFIAVSYFYP